MTMTMRVRRLRDVLAVLVVVLALAVLTGSPPASVDLPSAVGIVSDGGADSEQQAADDDEAAATGVASVILLMLGIGVSCVILLRGCGALTRRARAPPRAFVTGLTVTVLGA